MQHLSWRQVGADDRRYALTRLEVLAPWSFPLHDHQGFCDIHLVASGSERLTVNGRDELLGAGDLLLLRPRDRHDLAGERFLHYNLNVSVADLDRVAAYVGLETALTAARPPRVHLGPAALARAVTLAEDLRVRQFGPEATLALLPALAHFAGLLACAAQPVSNEPEWLAAAEALVGDDPSLGPGSLARALGVSPAHLARSFQRHRGCTPSAWLLDRRLARAALELSHSGRDILAICYACGFASVSHFYRTFRTRYGAAPAAWRAQRRAGAG
jgi:AraC-like DNA-binding protein